MHEPKLAKKVFKDLLFLIPLSSFFLIGFLWNESLASWDEGLYASVAKEIIRSGDWLNLTFQGGPWFDKPPLAIWITALFYKFFGISEFTSRLFSALCGVGAIITVYLLGQTLYNRWTGFCGALILLSSSHFFRMARCGMLDVPLAFFMALAFYFYWLGRQRNSYFYLSGLFLGLAFMTKSFAALFFIPTTILHSLLAGESDIIRRRSYWMLLFVAFLVVLPWHLYEISAHYDFFMRNVVSQHLFNRVAHAIEGHTGSWYFYIRTLVNKFHPWVVPGIFTAPYFIYKSFREKKSEDIFITVWMFFHFLAITAVQTKLAWYLVPAYLPLSICIGYFLAKLFTDKYSNWLRASFIVVMLLHMRYSNIFGRPYTMDLKGIAPLVQKEVSPDERIYLYDYHENPAFTFYVERKSAYLDTPQALMEQIKISPQIHVLIHKPAYEQMEAELKAAGMQVLASYDNLLFIAKR